MTTALPPDPYLVLGVSRDADSATIRSAHRKLVIKCHPDKVQDPALKLIKADEFHKVQQAYELLIDDAKRAEYERLLRLHKLKQETGRAPYSFTSQTTRTHPSGDYDVKEAAPRRDTFKEDHEEKIYSTTSPTYSFDDDINYAFHDDTRGAPRKPPRYGDSTRSKRTTSPDRRRREAKISDDERRRSKEDAAKSREKKKAREARERDADRQSKHEKYNRKPFIAEPNVSEDDIGYFASHNKKHREDEERAEAERERRRRKKHTGDSAKPQPDMATKFKAAAKEATAYMLSAKSSKSRVSGDLPEDHGRPLPLRRSATDNSHYQRKYAKAYDSESPVKTPSARPSRRASEQMDDFNLPYRSHVREQESPLRASRERSDGSDSPGTSKASRDMPTRPPMHQYASSPADLASMLPGREERSRVKTSSIAQGFFANLPGPKRAFTYTTGEGSSTLRTSGSRLHREYRGDSDSDSDHPTYAFRSPQSPPSIRRGESTTRQTSYRATPAGVRSSSPRYESKNEFDQDSIPRSRPPLTRNNESRHRSFAHGVSRERFDSEPLSRPKLDRISTSRSRGFASEPAYANYSSPVYADDLYGRTGRGNTGSPTEHRSNSYAYSPRMTRV